MIVRKINPQEAKRVQEFCALAFEYALPHSDDTPVSFYERITNSPRTRQELNCLSQWAAFEDDDRTMMSTLTVIPYRVQFDGHHMPMAGIGGVSTLPQYRKRGGIRACFEAALPAMYQDGVAFSYLYPFSNAYYRKFGYELGCTRNHYKLLMSALPKVQAEGHFTLLEPGTDIKKALLEAYAAQQDLYNMMTIDEEIDYRWADEANPFRDKEYTYLYTNASGKPSGFMTYALHMEQSERNLNCTRFCFADKESLAALFSLLSTLAADHQYVHINLPTDVHLEGLLPEWCFGNVEVTRVECGMVRVVNVESVLKAARMRGTGSIVLHMTDAQIPQNNGGFEVVFENDVVTNVSHTAAPADISLTIQAFSSLIVGRYDICDLQWLSGVELHCAAEKAAQVFYKKPLYISRYF